MSESTPINIQAFQPFDGGTGGLLSVTATSSAVAIPGTQAGTIDKDKLRLLVTNPGSNSVSVRIGKSGVDATLACLAILPGTQVLLTPPFVSPGGLWIAGICGPGATATIQVSAGQGT